MGGEAHTSTLGAAADLLTGFPFGSARFTDDPSATRLLRGDNVAQGFIRWDGARRWPAAREAQPFMLNPGDVVLAMDRPWIEAGLKHATLTEADCPSLLVQRVACLRARPGVDQRFLGYVIRSRAFTDYVLGVQTGTAVPHISGGQIKAYQFELPPLSAQRAAAALLGALDDKIELNRRMAQTLEAMARALFKSWFVDFDPVHAKTQDRPTGLSDEIAALFPDRFQDDGLPQGWSLRTFGELYEIRGGNTPATANPDNWNGRHQWATPKDLSSITSPVLLQTAKRISDTGLAGSTSGLLPVGSLLLSSRAPIGYMAFATRPVAINQGFAGIVKKHARTAYAWCWCEANMDVIKGNAGGSTFPEISKSILRRLPMLTPTPTVLKSFCETAGLMVMRMIGTAKQSESLAALRDTLLPKLISGEIRIREAEQAIVAA